MNPNIQFLPVTYEPFYYKRHDIIEQASTLAASLRSGQVLIGQTQISYNQDKVAKDSDYIPPPSPIQRVFYMNQDETHAFPLLYPTIVTLLSESCIIYAVGSLYTSLIPSLTVQGVGAEIANSKNKKILLLNTKIDRESHSLDASDFILAITDACNYSHWGRERGRKSVASVDSAVDVSSFGSKHSRMKKSKTGFVYECWPFQPSSIITHLFFNPKGEIKADREFISKEFGIECEEIPWDKNDPLSFDVKELAKALRSM